MGKTLDCCDLTIFSQLTVQNNIAHAHRRKRKHLNWSTFRWINKFIACVVIARALMPTSPYFGPYDLTFRPNGLEKINNKKTRENSWKCVG